MVTVYKGHAYGNDFLLAPIDGARAAGATDAGLARALCDRHHGIGADGLILYELASRGATMRLRNADGSASELSGNVLRFLAALVARTQRLVAG
jgi:diaminopimelate epimerase